MNIPDTYRKCVVFLCVEETSGGTTYKVPHGTAFFVAFPFADNTGLHWYLVTAAHNLIGIRKAGLPYFISINKTGGGKEYIKEVGLDKWVKHASADIAVMYFDIGVRDKGLKGDFDIAGIPATQFEHILPELMRNFPLGGKKDLDLGMDIFIPGLFTQYSGVDRNIPIIRTGHIAMYPAEKIDGIDAFLIEARSTGGLSGSPVMYDTNKIGNLSGEQSIKGVLGVIRAHWGKDKEEIFEDVNPDEEEDARIKKPLNMGIAVVTPAVKVWEMLMLPELVVQRTKVEDKISEEKNKPLLDS